MTRCRSGLTAALLVIALATAAPAFGQQPVVTQPFAASTTGGNVSSTIASTGVFQQLWANTGFAPASGQRKGCLISNESTHNMFVTEGLAIADSTQALAFLLLPGASYGCSGGGTVLVGQVNITGTAGDSFYAAQY